MAWASLQEAVEAVRAAGVGKPEETILRAVSNAGLVRPGSQPLPDRTPAAPRMRVITPRTIVGMDWLQAPVLDFEKSEILCRSFMGRSQEEFEPRRLHPARIELWREDVDRLWPAQKEAAYQRRQSNKNLAPRKYRNATDAANVEAAVAAIEQGTFTSANQAAGHFASKSEPGKTFEQNKDRLRKLIALALPKTAKDRQS